MYVNGPCREAWRVRNAQAQAEQTTARVKEGDIVKRPWGTFESDFERSHKLRTAKVIYVHPCGYYHVVQFTTKSGVPVREAFWGTEY